MFFIAWFVWNSLCHKQNKPPRKETPWKPSAHQRAVVFCPGFCLLLCGGVWKTREKICKISRCTSCWVCSLEVWFWWLCCCIFMCWPVHVILSCLSVQWGKWGTLCYGIHYRIHYLAFRKCFTGKGQVQGITKQFFHHQATASPRLPWGRVNKCRAHSARQLNPGETKGFSTNWSTFFPFICIHLSQPASPP